MPNGYSVAQVGAEKPMNHLDRYRWIMSLEWLVRNGFEPEGKPDMDVVNLLYDRDFLLERRQYDMVLMHCIFNPGMTGQEAAKWDRWACGISQYHTMKAWRDRLQLCGARFIFIHHQYAVSIEGYQMGDLWGYKADIDKEQKFSIFLRKDVYSEREQHRRKNQPSVPNQDLLSGSGRVRSYRSSR